MNIKTTLEKYKELGEYFSPEYDRDNEVLIEFKEGNPILSKLQTIELIELLLNKSENANKYFVADLLYLYDNFDKELLEPLITIAINLKDSSFNRIFIKPCIATFGVKAIAENLTLKFNKVDIVERIGILNLIYWLRPQENGETDKLHETILEKANHTSNIIELYHYKLRYSDKIMDGKRIPSNANELISAISGNEEYEDLLYNKLGWKRTTPANSG